MTLEPRTAIYHTMDMLCKTEHHISPHLEQKIINEKSANHNVHSNEFSNERTSQLGNYLYTFLAAKINKVKQRFLIENIATQSSIIAVYSGSLNSFSQSNENFCMMLDARCACLLALYKLD